MNEQSFSIETLNPEPYIYTWFDSVKFDKATWKRVLSEQTDMKHFEGKFDRATYVLETLGLGIRETSEEFRKKGIELSPPNLNFQKL